MLLFPPLEHHGDGFADSIDDCAKDGVEEFLTNFEQISQSNQSKFNVTQGIHGKKFLSAILSAMVY